MESQRHTFVQLARCLLSYHDETVPMVINAKTFIMGDNKVYEGISTVQMLAISLLLFFANAENTYTTKMCNVDSETAVSFRSHLSQIRSDCSVPISKNYSIPRFSDAFPTNLVVKSEGSVFAQKSVFILGDLENQNTNYENRIGKCMGHRFTLHETRRELNRSFPPSCSGYKNLIDESKQLEKNISNMVKVLESRIKWNVDVAKHYHSLIDIVNSSQALERLPASAKTTSQP